MVIFEVEAFWSNFMWDGQIKIYTTTTNYLKKNIREIEKKITTCMFPIYYKIENYLIVKVSQLKSIFLWKKCGHIHA